MKYLIVIAFALFVAVNAREYDRPCRNEEMSPRVKTAFNVPAYLGTWFEIRRYEAANQTDFDCVVARYTLNADGSVEVANSGYFQGSFIEFVGRATLSFPNQSPLPAKLDVTFAEGQPPSIYWVMSTDYVNYAVIWSCFNLPDNRSNESAWVISRTPEVSPAIKQRYVEVLAENNIVYEAMRETDQDIEECRIPSRA